MYVRPKFGLARPPSLRNWVSFDRFPKICVEKCVESPALEILSITYLLTYIRLHYTVWNNEAKYVDSYR